MLLFSNIRITINVPAVPASHLNCIGFWICPNSDVLGVQIVIALMAELSPLLALELNVILHGKLSEQENISIATRKFAFPCSQRSLSK